MDEAEALIEHGSFSDRFATWWSDQQRDERLHHLPTRRKCADILGPHFLQAPRSLSPNWTSLLVVGNASGPSSGKYVAQP